MSMKKPAVLLAFVGACALAFTGPASVASPLRAGPVPAEDTPASSLPVGDLDTALTSKDGQAPEVAEVVDRDSARLVGVIVQLEEGIDRSAALATVNEAVAASFPGVQVWVEREYANVLDGFALSAPAGSLEEIRGVAGVKAAFLEREGHVSDAAAVDAEGGTRASQIEGQDPANLSAQLMMRTDQVTQKGEGKVIAIIDTGVDMTHQAFTPALTATPALSEDKVDELKAQLGEGKTGVYVNEKFPFAYDYADGDNDASPREGGSGFHGTHVAGIAAGNADKIVGTAPDAQIIVGKVTRTEDDALLDSALLAALDDMLILHPDVINLSLGWTAGMDNEADTVYATVYKKLQEAGITVNAAAGNAFSTGYGNMSGKGLPYASNPDSSVIDEPATYPSVVAVASVENALIRNAFTAAGKDIGYQRSRGMNGEKVAYFSDLPAGTYEYVDAGFASEEDVAALTEKYPDGLTGKIALVSRGNMTYQKKVENLYDLHPAGVLVYNNVSVGSLIIMNLTTQDVPAAFISQADGQAMLEAADHHLTMAEGQVLPQSSVYEASEFSSWGVSPDLRLKPEIAAPGGNVFSAIPNGAYEQTSGTSMATPQMSGISAIVLQRVQSDPLFALMSAREQVDVVQNLIMGTARPLTDAAQDSGVLYSPRKQGSGLVDALAATTSSVYPAVGGASEVSRPKADLGDGTKGWHFDVVLHNLSDTEATYELGSQVLSEIVDGGFFTEHSLDWRGRGVAVSYSGAVSGAGEGATVTVPAKGEATVGVDIVPGFEFAQYVADNASSGTFLDGFVCFTSRTESQPSLSVPYVGFYGSWGKPAIFDALASDGKGHMRASGLYDGETGTPLGFNPVQRPSERPERPDAYGYVISRAEASGAPRVLEPRTGTLRGVHTLTTTYTNEAGEVVASFERHQNWKSVFDPLTTEVLWVEREHESTALDLRSEAYKDLLDGEYALTVSAHNDGPSRTEQSISYKFRIDTTAPVIEDVRYSGKDDDTVVTLTVVDSSPMAAFDLHDPADGLWFYRYILSDADQIADKDGKYRYEVDVPLSVISRAWVDQGGTGPVVSDPYVLGWDYGLNHSSAVTVNLPTGCPSIPPFCADPTGGHWVKGSGGWWYACADGSTYLANGWFTINGSDYSFGPDGYMMTGFLKRPSGEWVYADASGTLLSGWLRDGSYGGLYWYYMDPATKVMCTGWLFDRGSWYYLGDSGDMHTGWVKIDGLWYYLKPSGAMHIGWLQLGSAWYYLSPSGAMVTGAQVIDGRVYSFDTSGVLRR